MEGMIEVECLEHGTMQFTGLHTQKDSKKVYARFYCPTCKHNIIVVLT